MQIKELESHETDYDLNCERQAEQVFHLVNSGHVFKELRRHPIPNKTQDTERWNHTKDIYLCIYIYISVYFKVVPAQTSKADSKSRDS